MSIPADDAFRFDGMTPHIASVLIGWTGGGPECISTVLGASLSALVNDEVHCDISGSDDQFVVVSLYSAKDIDRVDELVSFVLEIRDSMGEHLFSNVAVTIRHFRHVTR